MPHPVRHFEIIGSDHAALPRYYGGGTREMGPEGTPGRLVVARFTDPEGNVIGLAGPM